MGRLPFVSFNQHDLKLLLRQNHVKSVQHFVDILFRNHQRWLESHDIAADAVFTDDEATVFHGFENLVQFFRGRAAVWLYEFCSVHQAQAADVADDGVLLLKILQALAKLLTTGVGIFHQLMLFNIFQHCQTCGRGHRVAAQGGCTGAGVGVGNLCRGNEGGDGGAVAQGLGHAHDVGHHIEVLDGKHLACAGKACLHLIVNEEGAIVGEDFLYSLEIPFGGHHNACIALDALGDEGGGLAGGSGLDDVLNGIGAGQIAFRVLLAQGAAVAVGIGGEVDASYRIGVGAPHADACEAHGEFGAAVEAVFEGDEFALACVDLGQEGGTLIGLGASGAEE